MSLISFIIALKIAFTLLFVALPFLFAPALRLEKNGTEAKGAVTLFRLYGVAITALLVGYASAFWVIARGEFPWAVVAMGLVSNAGAAIVLFKTGGWRHTKPAFIFVSSVAIALALAAAFPAFYLRPLW